MNKKELFKAIDQAFLPAKEIEIPGLFSGRSIVLYFSYTHNFSMSKE